MISYKTAAMVCALSVLGASAWASLGSIDSQDFNSDQIEQPKAGIEVGSVIALNQAMSLGNIVYPAGTELVVGENKELFIMSDDDSDDSNSGATGVSLDTLSPNEFTLVPVDPETGELSEYNIPSDFEVAGRGGHHSRRGGHKRGGKHHGGGGVKHCYRAAKAVLARRIHLTGVPAYSAAPQLRRAGWKRYDYASAPYGSACVFAAGGIVTSSGGAKYGHIGIKGYGGVISVSIGFKLHRPFLGCYHEA